MTKAPNKQKNSMAKIKKINEEIQETRNKKRKKSLNIKKIKVCLLYFLHLILFVAKKKN